MNKELENKMENKKSRWKFWAIMAVALLLGVIVGFLINLDHEELGLGKAVAWTAQNVIPWGCTLCIVLILALYFPMYGRAKALFKAWDGEDEETIEKADHILEVLLLWENVFQILCYFCFGCGAAYLRRADSDYAFVTILISVVSLLLFLVVLVLTQRRIVDLTKLMNPEKHGSVYDVHFQKAWMESCDEAEALQIYKAAFRAYRVAVRACTILWMVLVVASIATTMDLTALCCVSFLWLLLTVTYSKYAMQLSKLDQKG